MGITSCYWVRQVHHFRVWDHSPQARRCWDHSTQAGAIELWPRISREAECAAAQAEWAVEEVEFAIRWACALRSAFGGRSHAAHEASVSSQARQQELNLLDGWRKYDGGGQYRRQKRGSRSSILSGRSLGELYEQALFKRAVRGFTAQNFCWDDSESSNALHERHLCAGLKVRAAACEASASSHC